MTAYDELLTWLSSRGRASNGAVRTACEWLSEQYGLAEGLSDRYDAVALSRKVRFSLLESLNRLGHVEASKAGWEVLPPTLLIRTRKNGRRSGLFYGARKPGWKDILQRFSGLEFHCASPARGPEIWTVRESSDNRLERVATELELTVERARSLDFLRGVPSFREVLNAGSETRVPAELEAFRVIRKGKGWTHAWSTSEDRRFGLYRNRLQSYAAWYFVDNERVVSVPPGELRFIARWRVAARQQSLTIRYADKKLWLPTFGIPLPVLLDRALCMNVGHGPLYQDFGWRYNGLTEAHARELSRILDIKLKLQ